MESRFKHLKDRAVTLRKSGASIRDIEIKLRIPRSTLSNWFKDIKLDQAQKRALKKRSGDALAAARATAAVWHRRQKEVRLAEAKKYADVFLASFSKSDLKYTELALAFLYLGEGSKTNGQTSLGSSDPRIARFFIRAICSLYDIPIAKIRCDLHLRADQSPTECKRYWARELGISEAQFRKPVLDKRTAGSPTYDRYKGVCAIYVGTVAIQRRLMYIANGFCDRIGAGHKMRA